MYRKRIYVQQKKMNQTRHTARDQTDRRKEKKRKETERVQHEKKRRRRNGKHINKKETLFFHFSIRFFTFFLFGFII